MPDFHDRLANLSPAKRRLLEQQLQQANQGQKSQPIIARRDSAEPAPLSFGQQRQWFLQQLEPENTGYNKTEALTLTGSLNVPALQKAIEALVARHEILRTTYHQQGDMTVQMINEPTAVALPLIDLTDLDNLEQKAKIRAYISEARKQPFNLSQDLMFRHTLFRLAEDRHVFFRVMHHIASDKWSVGVLNRELSALYAAFSANQLPNLPSLSIQYVDYAIWQRDWFQGEKSAHLLDYWQKQLADAPMQQQLRLDYPRPAKQSHRGAVISIRLSKDQTQALKKLGQQHNATLFMTLLAAFDLLLYRYHHQADIVVGVPIAGRTIAETEGLIGLFINTLAFRTTLSGNPSFATLLERVRHTALEAYAHQDLPFEKLVETIKPPRIPGQTPIFQVMFDYLNTPSQALRLTSLDISPFTRKEETSIYDLTLLVSEAPTGALNIAFEYSTDIFKPETVNQMLSHYQTILDQVLQDSSQPIDTLPILSSQARQQLLFGWHKPPLAGLKSQRLHHLFEAQASSHSNLVAVDNGQQTITYGDLNQQANRLAHHLQVAGLKSGGIVALCLPSSINFIIGVLAALKAGGSYLPLDPTYPPARLAFMLTDSQAMICLTERNLRTHLPANSARIIDLDQMESTLTQYPTSPPTNNIQPTDPAYVIYTSGSTGTPKGAVIPHRAVVNFVTWAQDYYALGPGDRVLQFASIGFDTAIEEIFPTLASGATLVITADPLAGSFDTILQTITQAAITVLDLPTAFWHTWVAESAQIQTPIPATLRLVIVGGEKALLADYAAWCNYASPQIRWVNTYGPTETTVVALAFEPNGIADAAALFDMPIGQAITNMQAYILDPSLNPVPLGVSGELYLGGLGLASGYLNNTVLTKQAFINHTFSGTDSGPQRLYKTGDLVYRLPDGNIAYSGRRDRQIKRRGYRIEPDEIEVVMRRHPRVDTAIIKAQQIDQGEWHLTAYLVPKKNETVSIIDIRHHCEQWLPAFMQPAHILFLDNVPLTVNGKVDFSALPAPDSGQVVSQRQTPPPESDLERMLADMWCALLLCDGISRTDNFFDLGGHSLMATQLISRIKTAFDLDLPLRALFDNPTLAGLAWVIEDALLTEIESLSQVEVADLL